MSTKIKTAVIVAASLCATILCPCGTDQPDRTSKIVPDECCTASAWDHVTLSAA